MKYQAKNLKAEAYIAYSKDAFNDEKQGLAYFGMGTALSPPQETKTNLMKFYVRQLTQHTTLRLHYLKLMR